MSRYAVTGWIVVAALAVTLAASASAPPVGPLPKGPVTTIGVQHGQLFALVVPQPSPGLTWRGATNTNSKVARPLDEGELNGNIVFVYKALAAGKTTIAYGLTKGETTGALKSQTFKVTVS